jgi:hypothetical protein
MNQFRGGEDKEDAGFLISYICYMIYCYYWLMNYHSKSTPNFIVITFRTHYIFTGKVVLSLVVKNAKSSNSVWCRCVCTVFASLISPILWYDDLIDRTEDVHFKLSISFCGCCETWGSVDLDQPRFTVIVDENIEAVELEAMLIVNDDALYAFEGHYYHVVYIFETTGGFLGTENHL